MGLWNLQVFIICCMAPRHVALLRILLDIDVRGKSDSKNIANPPGQTKKLIWQVPEGIFQNNKHL